MKRDSNKKISSSSRIPTSFKALQANFQSLLGAFHSRILPAHSPRYTQYLLFYLTSLDPIFMDATMGKLVEIVANNSESVLVRSQAAAYIGSWCARAKFMDIHYVLEIMDCLGSFINHTVHREALEYTSQQTRSSSSSSHFYNGQYYQRRIPSGAFSSSNLSSRSSSPPSSSSNSSSLSSIQFVDIKRWRFVYEAVQAVMYIFCFRWRDMNLIRGENGLRSVLKPIERIVNERRWNVLKVKTRL